MRILTDLYTFPSVGPTVQALRKQTLRRNTRDIHGGAVVKTSPSNTGAAGLIPDQGVRIPKAKT